MGGLEHRGVDVHMVDDVLRLMPPQAPTHVHGAVWPISLATLHVASGLRTWPALLVGELDVNMGREHAVVEEVVVVLGRLVGDRHAAQPLDHSATDAAGEQGPDTLVKVLSAQEFQNKTK